MKIQKLILACFLVCLVLPNFSVSAQSSSVFFEMEYGFADERMKTGRYVPFLFTIQNPAHENFIGYIECKFNIAGEESNLFYQREFQLSDEEQSIKETMTLFIPSMVKSLSLTLYDKASQNAIGETTTVNFLRKNQGIFTGILSEPDYEKDLSWMKEYSLYGIQEENYIVSLAEELAHFSGNALEWDMLDTIIWEEYSADQLSQDQLQGLADWVESGGVLLICASGQSKGKLEKLTEVFPFLGFGEKEDDFQLGNKNLFYLEPRQKGYNRVVKEQEQKIAQVRALGKGLVASIGLSFADLHKTGYEASNKGFVRNLIQNILGKKVLNRSLVQGVNDAYQNAHSILYHFNFLQAVNITLCLILLFIYVFFIGPILFFVLQSKARLDLYPRIVFSTALLSIIGIYVLCSHIRVTEPFFQYVSTEEWNNRQQKKETVLLNINAANLQYKFSLNPAYQVIPLSKSQDFEVVQTKVRSGENILQENIDSTNFSVLSHIPFVEQLLQLKTISYAKTEAPLSANLSFFEEKLQGTVENHLSYDLNQVVLIFHHRVFFIELLKANSKLEIDPENIEIAYSTVNLSYELAEKISGENPVKLRFLYQYLSNHPEIYQNQATLLAFSPLEENKYILYTEKSKMDGVKLLSVACEVNEQEQERVYYSTLKENPRVEYEDQDEWSKENLALIYNEEGNHMQAGSTLTLSYSLPEEQIQKLALLISKKVQDEDSGAIISQVNIFQGKILIWNVHTKEYENLDYQTGNDIFLSGEALESFLNENREIKIQYQSSIGELGIERDMFLPIFSVLTQIE
ncbi:hypothetical protein FACS189418_4620 [Clostridia bacterium]|nr:hypothetical protein FACS189418_4620 [Clostridia bacterium]